MAWAIPEYSRNQVDKAGKVLAAFDPRAYPVDDFAAYWNSLQEYKNAVQVINNWRSAHSYPLNAFQMTLRRRGRVFDKNLLVAQRIKRLESIAAKLSRQTTQLSQMQDIGGCRAILSNQKNARLLSEKYIAESRDKRFLHSLKWQKDYVQTPKRDGYRGYHLIFAYSGSEKYRYYNNLRIEIQIRSLFQHAWATAVEAVGTFTQQALKANQGNKDWLRFFALMGSAIAYQEDTPCVPDTPNIHSELISELRECSKMLRVDETLRAYNTALNYTNKIKDAKYFLMNLDLVSRKISISRFSAAQSQIANEKYTEMETEAARREGVQVVLVSVDSLAGLKKAYPNYFLDTQKFTDLLGTLTSK